MSEPTTDETTDQQQTTDTDEWGSDVWAAGAYERTAKQFLPMAARLVDHFEIESGDTVLDIGTGTGNLAITAAREGATVTGVDICPELLEKARTRAETTETHSIEFDEGDAASLPYADDTFDLTLSTLGHMYADPPSAAATELLRVTKPGGRIGFTSWGPMSLYPRLAGVAVQHVPPAALPEYSEPPFLWGDEDTVRDRLEPAVTDLTTERFELSYPAVGPAEFWQQTKQNSGLFQTLLEGLDPETLDALDADMISAVSGAFDPAENVVSLSYVQTTAVVEA